MIEDLKKFIENHQAQISSFRYFAEEDFFEYGEDTNKQKHLRGCIRMLQYSIDEIKSIIEKHEYYQGYTMT